MIEPLYEEWLKHTRTDSELHEELLSVKGDAKAVEDRFYRELSFGTGGLRGVLGAGTNRMNVYSVGKATFGLAAYLLKERGDRVRQPHQIPRVCLYNRRNFFLQGNRGVYFRRADAHARPLLCGEKAENHGGNRHHRKP